MSILSGAFCKDIKAAAVGYLLNELSVIPLVGKVNKWGWKVYTGRRAHITDIHWWQVDGKLKNLGIVCGAVSGNLVVIDLDGQEAIDLFKSAFGDLMAKTFTVRTGSGGLHVYLQVDTMPPNRKVKIGTGHSGIEIRGEGQYVVAVPSIHPDTGKPYEIHVRKPVLRLDGLWEVNNWLNTLETPKKAVLTAKAHPAETGRGVPLVFGQVRYPQLWTNAAVAKECQIMARSSEGRRNDQLNTSAYNLGQIVGIGWLTMSNAEAALLDAAKSAGLSESEALPTIQSGLTTGMGAARDTQWQKRK